MSELPENELEITYNEDGTPDAAGWRTIGRLFRKPIAEVQYRPAPGGNRFAYIDARQVMDRLDKVVGPGNWQSHFFVQADGSVECTITVYNSSKADVGYKNNPKAQPGDNTYEYEPLKAAYSDALKRAAVQWGIGRFLYDS